MDATSKLEHLQRHDPSCLAPMEHSVSASAYQVGGDLVLREPATASFIPSSFSNDSRLVGTQGLLPQGLAVPATHYGSQEDNRLPYVSHGGFERAQSSYWGDPFPPAYLHNPSSESYPDGEKLSDVPTLTDDQQEIRCGSSGGGMDHYQRSSVPPTPQWFTDMFPAFPERDNDCLPPGHSALKTDDFPKLVSHSADDAGRPHAYYQQASTPITQPVPAPHPGLITQQVLHPHLLFPHPAHQHFSTQPAYPNTTTQPAPLSHPQWPSYTLPIESAVPAPTGIISEVLANPSPASDSKDMEKPTMCGWHEENQTIPCNTILTESNLQEHLASHGIEHMASNTKVKCRSCTRPKEMKRESILRHFRECHMKQRRKPSKKKNKLVEG